MRSPEYRSWSCMIQRCNNSNFPAFHRYGGRGIKVCDRWRGSYLAFLEDMGPRPSKNYTLERIDNDGDYEPGNCRWDTRTAQARNTRSNRKIEYRGVVRCISEWCEKLGLPLGAIYHRVQDGWSAEKTLETPVRNWTRRKT